LELLIQCDVFLRKREALGKEIIYNPLTERFNNLVEQHFTQPALRGILMRMRLHVHPNHLNFISKKNQWVECQAGYRQKDIAGSAIFIKIILPSC